MPQVIIFEACGIAVEDMQLPNGQPGKCINIIDQESGMIYKYMMTEEHAKSTGGKLMGLGDLVIPTAIEQPLPPSNGHKKH